MGRPMTAGFKSAIQADKVEPFYIAKLITDVGSIKVWTGIGDLPFDAGDGDGEETYSGNGSFLGVSNIEETEELRAGGITLSLSGVPAEFLAAAQTEIRQGLLTTLWLGLFDTSTKVVIPSPIELFAGITDVAVISVGAHGITIAVSIENRMVDFQRPRRRDYTNEDQRQEYADDRGFEFVPSLQDQKTEFKLG